MSLVSVDDLRQKNKALDTRMDGLQGNMCVDEDYEMYRLVANKSSEATATVIARSTSDMESCQRQFSTAGTATNVSVL